MALINPALSKAARALAKVDLTTAADGSGLLPEAIEAFESENGALDALQLCKLKTALETLGVLFLAEEPGLGPGVRLRFTSDQAARIEAWEEEGGTAKDDDVP